MKKLLFVSMALMLVMSIPAPVHAQGEDVPAELAYYDAQIGVMLPRLEAFQDSYYAINGRYYQALTSHTEAPDVPEVPDAITAHPTDQPEDLALFWESFAALPSALAWSFSIDTYSSPDGDGYVLTVATGIDGETWMRSVNFGPSSEDWRTVDWYKVIPFEI